MKKELEITYLEEINTHGLLERNMPRKIYGLLLCEDMSITDLAEKIHNNKNQRGNITEWIKKLLKDKMIRRTDLNVVIHKKLYRANFSVFGDFNEKEKKFIEVIMSRFIDKNREDIVGEFIKTFDKIAVIQMIFRKMKKIDYYGEDSKDFKDYLKIKDKFWRDESFRNKFLDSLKDKKPIKNIRRDFIFMSLISPEHLSRHISQSELNDLNSPLYISRALLE